MKQEQQQQAESLFFQTDLTKSEIAKMIGISRRSMHYWVKDNDWDRLKKSSDNMPSLLAENTYIIISRLQESILSDARMMKPITKDEVGMLHKLTTTVNKLKNRGTLNENLEMMGYFMDHLQQLDPAIAETMQPIVNNYVKTRAKVNAHQFMPPKFNEYGLIPQKEQDLHEAQLDLEDLIAWTEESPFLDESLNQQQAAEKQAAQETPKPPQASQPITQPAHTNQPAHPTTETPLHAFKTQNLNRAQRRELARNLNKKKQPLKAAA